MGSHSVTYTRLPVIHPTEVRFLPLPPAEAGTLFSDLKGCKAEMTYVAWQAWNWTSDLPVTSLTPALISCTVFEI